MSVRFADVPIARKFVWFNVAIAVLIAGLGALAVVSMARINASAEEIGKSWLPGIRHLAGMRREAAQFRIHELQHAAATDAAIRAERENGMRESADEFESRKAKYVPLIILEEEKTALDKIEKSWAEYLTSHEKALALSKAGRTEDSLVVLNGEAFQHFETMVTDLNDLVQANSDGSDAAVTEAAQTYRRALAGLVFGLFGVVVAAMFVGRAMSRAIANPLATIGEQMLAVSEGRGDLAKQLEVPGQDEIGVLTATFNKFLAFMRAVAQAASESAAAAQEMAASSEEAARATQQISQTIQQVAVGSGQQTQQVTDTASSVEQLTQAVDQLARGAQEQARSAQEATRLMSDLSTAIDAVGQGSRQQTATVATASSKGEQVVQAVGRANAAVAQVRAVRDAAGVAMGNGEKAVARTVEGMQRIEATTAQAAERIEDLGQRSQQIGEIIAVIDDIADQTNLLALNAAIEAARAGEHGKGFAVVADEVRKLAERSGKATKEIAGLIAGIRDGVAQTVAAMQQGRQEVGHGVEVVGEARQALVEINESSQATGTSVAEIERMLGEVAAVAAQVDEAMRQIAEVSESNAARSQQMEASAQTVLRSVENIAAVTQEASASTQQMSASTGEISQAVQNIAAISEENGASAEEVSAAAEEQTAGVQQMAASAQQIAQVAARLQEMVAQTKGNGPRDALGSGARLAA